MKKAVLLFFCVSLLNVMNVSAKGTTESSTANAATAVEDYTIKIGIGITTGLCSAPFLIARELGYYKEEGLKYEEVRIDTNQSNQLLTTGQIDVINNLLSSLILPLANGLDIKIPLALHTCCIKVLVPTESAIQTPADLKGKKIGVPSMASPPTIIAQRYLAEVGVSVSPNNLEVEWLVFPSTELPLAMERGQVDAIALTDPIAWITESTGKARAIINTATDAYMKDEFCCVVEASSTIAKKYPQTLAKFTRALQKAARYVQENPEETARLLAETQYVAGDPVVNGQVLRSYSFRASVSEAKTAITRNTQDLQNIGLVPKDIDVNTLVNNTFIALPGVPDSLY
jgi:NitT/TauT family transport system substrate-binding protein